MRRAIYPGSFDPVTNGHLDIIERAAALFDEVVVAVARDTPKAPLFPVAEREEMLREACAHLKNVKVESFSGLLVDFARSKQAKVIVKGLRAVSDFETELQMALMNRTLREEIETVFLMTRHEYLYLSSSIVKEIAGLGGEVGDFVPPMVKERLRQKLQCR